MTNTDIKLKDFLTEDYNNFIENLKGLVSSSKYKAARSVNKELVILYHSLGQQILRKQSEEGWGAKIIQKISKDLSNAYPEMKGFSIANLHNMRRFAELYSSIEIIQQAAGELPWYHHVILMERIKDEEERLFYIKNATEFGWSRSILIHQIELNLYQRQGKAITNFGKRLTEPTSSHAQQILKDPYTFDFLSLGNEAQERAVENALVKHMEEFLMELGQGFAFVGRQYHLKVADQDFYIDLLFYHLKLRSFVVIELKDKDFKPEYAGKMNFYLSAVDDLIKHPSDNPSIGLILCKSKNDVLAEYALRDMTKPIGLAEYRLNEALPDNIKTELPTIEELEAKLSQISIKSEDSDV